MLVSIIVPVYNREYLIEQTIKSLQSQTYKEIEIVIVDDGSTDSTYEICKKLSEEDSRILLLQRENGGTGEARNTGLDHATGDFIMFCDSDDIYFPFAVELLYNSLRNTDFKVKMAVADHVDGFDSAPPLITLPEACKEEIITQEEAFEWLIYKQPSRWVTMAWKIFAKELFIGVRAPQGLRIYEDTYVTYKLIGQCDEIIKIDVPVYYYRHHPESTMIKYGMKDYIPLYRGYMDRALYFMERNMEKLYNQQKLFIENRLKMDYNDCLENKRTDDIKTLCRIHRQYFKENFCSFPIKQKIKRAVKCIIGKV